MDNVSGAPFGQTRFEQAETFAVTQRVTMMVNRYEVRHGDEHGPLVAFAQQKRMAMREKVTFYVDESRRQPLFSFRADRRIDLGARYSVTDGADGAGTPIGSFRKDFAASLLRSTWHLEQPGLPDAVGRERNAAVAILRRVWEIVPFVNVVPFMWPLHFDFVTADGRTVLRVERSRSLRDRYRVTVPDPRLDRRLAAAVAVGLDALMGR